MANGNAVAIKIPFFLSLIQSKTDYEGKAASERKYVYVSYFSLLFLLDTQAGKS